MRQRPLRLLIFTAERIADGYGSATALRTFLQAVLDYSDWHLTVVAPKTAGDVWQHYPGERARFVFIPVDHRTSRRTQLLRYVTLAFREGVALAPLHADAVVSWQPMPAGLVGAAASRAGRVPHVVRTCGPELARSWSRFPAVTAAMMPATRRLLRRADAVVVKSEVERRLVGSSLAGRVHLIPNAVGREFFVPCRAYHDNVTRLLTVCQLEAHKGVARLIAALAGTQPRRCWLTVIGDGSRRPELERAATTTGVHAEFLGRLPHSELPALYAAHDAFVLPSVLEGCSNAVLEAMAAGLPVIGTRSALSDLVDDGVNGILAEGPDEHSFMQAIERFLLAPAARPSLRHAARQRAAKHTPERLFVSYRDLFGGICERASSAKARPA
jgi:glycosyltransferase involved in cell wall biosynthesis